MKQTKNSKNVLMFHKNVSNCDSRISNFFFLTNYNLKSGNKLFEFFLLVINHHRIKRM